jgi:hypothetical protein
MAHLNKVERLIDYIIIQQQYHSTSLDPEQLGFSTLTPPADPTDKNKAMQVKKWEIAYKTYSDVPKPPVRPSL